MTVTKLEARRIVEIWDEFTDDDFDPGKLFGRISEEMPHATVGDVEAVLEARAFELREDAARCRAQANWCEFYMGVQRRAIPITGNREIRLHEAATLMAARGDRDATLILQQLDSPEAKLQRAELDAAIEAHPGWESYNEPGHFGHEEGCTEDTVEKLLAWYRRRAS